MTMNRIFRFHFISPLYPHSIPTLSVRVGTDFRPRWQSSAAGERENEPFHLVLQKILSILEMEGW